MRSESISAVLVLAWAVGCGGGERGVATFMEDPDAGLREDAGAAREDAGRRRRPALDGGVDGGVGEAFVDAGVVAPDAGPPDAGPSCDPAACALGCCDDHCCGLVAANEVDFGVIEPTGLRVEPPPGTFDTDAQCTALSALGRCSVVATLGGDEACVCRVDSLTIGGDLRVVGGRALAILAWESVTIAGTLDVGASGTTDGPGASSAYVTSASSLSAGAGGSYGSTGGRGAAVWGDPGLEPLFGGMRGEDACGGSVWGGGAGGALQISAGARIDIDGIVDASGGGGRGGTGGSYVCGGGGGGSGGAVLLEAPVVRVTGAVSANGGGGGGGASSNGHATSGSDGRSGTGVASGGSGGSACGCPLFGWLYGASGGQGAAGASSASGGGAWSSDGRCIGSTCYGGAGGGGGGVGRIHVRTSGGCACGGTFSPAPTFGVVTLR